MDIAIPHKVLRQQRLGMMGRWLAVIGVALALLLVLRLLISPSLDADDLRTAIVERGHVSTEVQASGVVVPENERVLVSPLNSSITDLYVVLGSKVHQGEALLKLDDRSIVKDIERISDELHLKDLQMQGVKQTQERNLRELDYQQELLEIDLEHKLVIAQRYASLYEDQIVSRLSYEEVQLDVSRTEMQLRQLKQQREDALEADINLIDQNVVERRLLEQELAKQKQLLDETTIRAGNDGIVTVLMNQLGQNVTIGAELARISDLSTFRVDASLSDYFLHQIAEGMQVRIDLGSSLMAGRIDRILPAVDNGTLHLQIELDDPANVQLKQNLRVDASIVTQQKIDGLRVANGIVFNGSGIHDIFVLEDGKAVKRKVDVGLSNSRYVEILSGLTEGEQIIISDMSDYNHLNEVAVRE